MEITASSFSNDLPTATFNALYHIQSEAIDPQIAETNRRFEDLRRADLVELASDMQRELGIIRSSAQTTAERSAINRAIDTVCRIVETWMSRGGAGGGRN